MLSFSLPCKMLPSARLFDKDSENGARLMDGQVFLFSVHRKSVGRIMQWPHTNKSVHQPQGTCSLSPNEAAEGGREGGRMGLM